MVINSNFILYLEAYVVQVASVEAKVTEHAANIEEVLHTFDLHTKETNLMKQQILNAFKLLNARQIEHGHIMCRLKK